MTETYWRSRLKALQVTLDHDQAFADALQVQINSLTTDFVNRDDPAQRAVIGQNKQKALDEARQQLDDMQEQAHKAGVAPADKDKTSDTNNDKDKDSSSNNKQ